MSSTEIELSYRRAKESHAAGLVYWEFLRNEVGEIELPSIESDEVEDHIKTIFKASFPFSNGSPLVQMITQYVALDLVRQQVGQDALVDCFDTFELDPGEFYPPRRHAEVDHTRLDTRITEIWNIYADIAHNLDDPDEVTETEELPEWGWNMFKGSFNVGVHYLKLWEELCVRDSHYLQTGRPKATSEAVKYRSIAKAHVLDGVTTGSEEIDLACQIVRASVKYTLDKTNPEQVDWLARGVRKGYKLVEKSWELQHEAPGGFTPQDFAHLVGYTAIDAHVEGEGWAIV